MTAEQRPAVPTAALVAAGLLGGAVGFVAGGYAGAWYYAPGDEWIPTGAVVGALLGETIGVPLGVHLANGRRGNLLQSFLLSGVATGAGVLLAVPTSGISLLAVPPAQIAFSIHVERRGR